MTVRAAAVPDRDLIPEVPEAAAVRVPAEVRERKIRTLLRARAAAEVRMKAVSRPAVRKAERKTDRIPAVQETYPAFWIRKITESIFRDTRTVHSGPTGR